MIVTCDAERWSYVGFILKNSGIEGPCGRTYDDAECSTICPHDSLPPKLSEDQLREIFDSLEEPSPKKGSTLTSFNEYAEETDKTAVYPDAGTGTLDAVLYVGLGLAGEAGEVANKIKKILRDDDGEVTEERIAQIKGELGGVLWYWARLCIELEIDPDEVAVDNIETLLDRQKRGVLKGSGDNR